MNRTKRSRWIGKCSPTRFTSGRLWPAIWIPFIAIRCTPWRRSAWPSGLHRTTRRGSTAPSRLLRNDGGRFVDATAELAPGFEALGMVTGAVWSDADADGWVDLFVTAEWGPIAFFRNTGAEAAGLEDATVEAGLSSELGWWNGIASVDLDGDGDLDYVATNIGLNSKYHADPEHPALLFCGDFDENGSFDIVEAKTSGGELLPVRGRSCSSDAMPFIAQKFPTYHDFASATLKDIYSSDALESSITLEATRLETVVLRNRGDAFFDVEVLPRFVQAAPGFGIVTGDVDADGWPDVYIAQNFYSPEPETGRMSGGVSVLLRGDGQGGLALVEPQASGLVVPQDAKAAALVDLDQDARPDVVVATNDGPLRVFRNRVGEGRALSVRLVDGVGNPTAVGALVTLVTADGRRQTAEVHAGSGYLSQSPATLFFGLGDSQARELQVRWPDGTTSVHTEDLGGARVLVSRL